MLLLLLLPASSGQIPLQNQPLDHWTTQNDALNHHIMVGRNGRYPWEESRFVGVNAADATP